MSDVIGRGVIEVSVDATKVKAGVEDSKRSIKSLGDASKDATTRAAASIDRYIQRLQTQNATIGMSVRETELYKLSLRGASDSQLRAADSALKLKESYEESVEAGNRIRIGLATIATASAAAAVAAFAVTQAQIEQIASYQDLADKIGDTAVNVASLQKASDLSGVSLDSVASASVRLTTALSKADEETDVAVQGIKALGINFDQFKKQSPVEQIDAIAQAMAGFADGSEKTAVATAIFGKSGAELVPILNDLADGAQRYTDLTAEQISQADAFSKAQASLNSEFQTFLKLQTAEALPAMTAVQQILAELVRDETAMSVVTETLRATLNGAVAAFQTIAIVGSDVGFVFLSVGREIGAVAAQLTALATLDFDGFKAISEAVKEDGERARRELDKFQARVMAIGQTSPVDPIGNASDSQNDDSRPTINTNGLNTSGASALAQAAKSQLTADLNAIKSAQESVKNSFANAEKILEARRAANLISDKEYYDAKRAFINLNSEAEARALEQQIARLQKEELAGKEKIDNDRAIADAQAKLAIVRANASANLAVLATQEEAANTKIAKSYIEATKAAQSYIDTISKQYERDLAGMGRGAQQRERDSIRNSTDDRYEAQRQGLARDLRRGQLTQEQYDAELEIINRFHAQALQLDEAYWTDKLALQGHWELGASEALNNYLDLSRNVALQTEDLFSNAFHGMEDALVDFVMTGRASFSDLAKSIIADIIRIQARKVVSSLGSSLLGSLGGLFGSGQGSWTSGFDLNAKGNAFMSGQKVTAFANGGAFTNGIVSQPTAFNMGLMGEAGPEAIMPLRRGPDGSLGVQASGGKQVQVSYAPVIHIDSRTDRAEVEALVNRSVRQGNAELVDRLQRAGAIG